MRLGIFGGTFDPVHMGHLILAEQAREQGRLEQVLFVPAARPPHKQEQPLTPFAQRVEMLSLAIAGNPAFRIEQLERDRPGPSYTVDTLEELRRRQPDAELWLLVGSDMLGDLPSWHDPAGIATRAGLLVAARPGAPAPAREALERGLNLPPAAKLRLEPIAMPLIDISSRDLRRRAAAGCSLRYFVPRAVEVFVREKRLYTARSDP